MDEVDIDAEDINELESRLYAQIHHEAAEAVAAPSISAATPQLECAPNGASARRIVTATSVINRPIGASCVPDSRYWANGLKTAKQTVAATSRVSTPTPSNTTAPKPPVVDVVSVIDPVCPRNDNTVTPKTTLDAPTASVEAESAAAEVDSVSCSETLEKTEIVPTAVTTLDPTPVVESPKAPKQQNTKNQKKEKEEGGKECASADLRINPAAVSRGRKLKQNKRPRSNAQQPEHIARTGPFMQQEIKLEKTILIEAKKQKSKKVRAKKQQQQQQQQQNHVVTIVLGSSEESECDVVLVPTLPPPLITLDDSDSEEAKSSAPQLEEENAMDAADVAITKKSAFSKSTSLHKMDTKDVLGKRVEPSQMSSRCTSPCSVLSSDDFIGQTDRSRLLKNNCMADDQDLVLLTADVDSLMQAPQQVNDSTTNICTPEASGCAEDDSSSNEVVCTAEFATPLATTSAAAKAAAEAEAALTKKNKQNDYRVDQMQFRALDVYDSESDITDSVYSKGCTKATTVILAAGSSSEDADDVQRAPVSQKTKRYVKRLTSSSNRGSETHNGDSTESDTEDEVTDGATSTGVAYILHGEAIEREGRKKLKRSRSANSRRISAGGKTSSGNMSDTEFIATLNNLVHGVDEDDEAIVENIYYKDDKSNTESDEPEQKRFEIAAEDEASLQSVRIVENDSPYAIDALPEDAVAGLDNLFKTIDNLSHVKTTSTSLHQANSSDDEVEIVNPTTQGNTNTKELSKISPTYHVIYNEKSSILGGFGWNDEMRKFYNNSWRGEYLTLIGVQNGMDRDKKLWKIYTEDRFPKGRPYSHLKCYNCCEFGHTRAKCKRPKKPPICYMCGESGHYEPRCPNTMCLRCGNKTQMFTKSCNVCTFQNKLICPICKVRGHAINLCPDKWRRYHSTTLPNAYPDSQMTFNRRKMCCICGGNGHFSETCRSAVRFLEYPVIVGQAKSHQKSYSDVIFKQQPNGIAFNLLYKPSEIVEFHFAENAKASDYYGRFLKAVGLGHLLRRKRISNVKEKSERPPKQAKNLPAQCQPNSDGEASKVDEIVTARTEGIVPDQVQEVSGSDNMNIAGNKSFECDKEMLSNAAMENSEDATSNAVLAEMQIINNSSAAASNNEAEESNQFKAPNTSQNLVTSNTAQDKEALTMDSDSNYSFSEHFEMANPSTSNSLNAVVTNDPNQIDVAPSTSKSSLTVRAVREMEPLPDFIPLTDDNENNEIGFNDNIDLQAGISRRFVAADSDDETDNQSDGALPDLPCEAKIYLTHFHSNYLLSPEGHEFLIEKSQSSNVKARLDWTSVGHVLVLYGLPKDQDKFHGELLIKYRELSDNMNNKQLTGIKVPKRTDVLIRFLRDNIIQLQNNLGDVNELQHRIQQLEKTHTKANMKLAEKCRRLLNMILLGQAGLCDGNMHLDKLLLNLRTLINEHRAENLVPNSLREEIDSHSKAIFTSYRHDNYAELIRAYNNMESKSRIAKLNLDPMLLGQKLLNTSLTREQKQRLDQLPPAANPQKSNQVSKGRDTPPPPAPSMKTQSTFPTPPAPSMKLFMSDVARGRNKFANTPTALNQATASAHSKSRLNQATPGKKQSIAPYAPPFTNAQQRSTIVTRVAQNWKNNGGGGGGGGTMFSGKTASAEYGRERGNANANVNTGARYGAGAGTGAGAPSKGPSLFWSRESLRYLDECINLAECNAELLEKLQRIQKKSHEGALSYNDYRAVIKLHGAMIGN